MSASVSTGTRRERKTDRTRAAIREAAVQLFEEKGFAETTIDEIADRADIAPRTFFRYYPTKEALLFDDSSDQIDEIIQLLRDRPADESPYESLVAVLRAMASRATAADERRRKQVMAKAASGSPHALEHHRAVVMCALEEAAVDVLCERMGPDADRLATTAAVAAVLAAFGTAMRTWLAEGAEGDLEPILDRCVVAARAAFGG
jgi:AcrR family transcriptional regulator